MGACIFFGGLFLFAIIMAILAVYEAKGYHESMREINKDLTAFKEE